MLKQDNSFNTAAVLKQDNSFNIAAVLKQDNCFNTAAVLKQDNSFNTAAVFYETSFTSHKFNHRNETNITVTIPISKIIFKMNSQSI